MASRRFVRRRLHRKLEQGNAPEYLTCRLSLSMAVVRTGRGRRWHQLRMEWSDGTKATLTPTDRIGELGFGLGLRAIQAERAIRKADARIRELEAELQQGEGQAPRWELDLVELRQLIQEVPNSNLGALLRTYRCLGAGG